MKNLIARTLTIEDFNPNGRFAKTTSKPVKPANLAAGIASMRQRITELETEKAKLLNQMDTATDALEQSLNKHLASMNKDIAIAREGLDSYQRQLGMQN